jgi:hypothetical protein
MHALRLLRKRFCYAPTASQAHLDFSRRGNPSFAHRFLLASIGQAQAVPAGEWTASAVQQRDTAATVSATIIIWYVDGQERVATANLLTYVLRVPVAQQTTAHGQRLAIIMERIGWQRPAGGTLRIGGIPARGYWRRDAAAVR